MPLLIALQFLTRLPVRLWRLPDAGESGRSLLWYPLVGLLLGVALLLGQWLLGGVSVWLQAALLLTLWVWLSGGLHLDGLADTFDGLAGGRTKEDRLRIMKDSSTGSFGLVAVVLALLLKFAFLQTLQGERLLAALFFSPLLSRWSMVVLMFFTPYARKTESLGKPFVEQIAGGQLILATVFTVAAGFFYPSTFFLVLVLPVLLFVFLLRQLFLQKLGGITGDCLGATNELLELAVLFLLLLPFPLH